MLLKHLIKPIILGGNPHQEFDHLSKLKDVIGYIWKHYPYPFDLNHSRLMKLVYLIDREVEKRYNHSCTSVEWQYGAFGPYAKDVAKVLRARFDSSTLALSARGFEHLTSDEMSVIDDVIDATQGLTFNGLVNHVHQAYPFI